MSGKECRFDRTLSIVEAVEGVKDDNTRPDIRAVSVSVLLSAQHYQRSSSEMRKTLF